MLPILESNISVGIIAVRSLRHDRDVSKDEGSPRKIKVPLYSFSHYYYYCYRYFKREKEGRRKGDKTKRAVSFRSTKARSKRMTQRSLSKSFHQWRKNIIRGWGKRQARRLRLRNFLRLRIYVSCHSFFRDKFKRNDTNHIFIRICLYDASMRPLNSNLR